jgi:arabinose-5-phosphate isomerase
MVSSLDEGRRVLGIEAQAILNTQEKLDASFEEAVDLLYQCQGKVVCSGMGKSGQIARKIASTLSSTGTPAVFLHPAESSHWDLGVIAKNDVILAISYSGESSELDTILKFASRRGIPVLAFSANADSSLVNAADIFLDIGVSEEACPLGLAPTTSSTVTLALGDALAMAVLKKRGFTEEEFAEFHPGGKLGRRLLTRVRDVMHKGEALPLVPETEKLREVLVHMTNKEVKGVAGVIDGEGKVIGVITDGDIRRQVRSSSLDLEAPAKSIMSMSPKTIDANELAQKALFVMEQFRIQTLFVVDSHSETPHKPMGLIHVQDLIRST